MNLALHSMSHIIIHLCFLHGLFDVINFLGYMAINESICRLEG